jgi:hypothetical protein
MSAGPHELFDLPGHLGEALDECEQRPAERLVLDGDGAEARVDRFAERGGQGARHQSASLKSGVMSTLWSP